MGRIRKKKKTEEEIQKQKEEFEKLWELFEKLWRSLHKRECWNCGCRIYGQNRTIYWDHLLEKSKYPELKYEEENLFFCCPDCHEKKGNAFPGEKHLEAIERAKIKFLNKEENGSIS